MKKRILAASALVLAWSAAAFAATANEPLTVFDNAKAAWAAGTVSLGPSLAFREGRVLVFPCQIDDLLWAKQGKPRNLMLVYEIPAAEVEEPFFKTGDVIFAPIRLLPDHSFWRDNLPNTPRHGVAGGRRNVFRGDEIAEARRLLGLFLRATEIETRARWGAELEAVSQALSSSVPRLIEDAVSFLSASSHLATDFPEAATEPISRFLEGTRPDAEKIRLIDALGRAKVTVMREVLGKLGAGEGAVAAASMVALDQMGTGASRERLLELSKSPGEEVRAYAAARLGADRSGDQACFERASALLEASQPTAVRAAAASGMGWAGNTRALEPLRLLLTKGDAVVRTAAEAIAAIGGEEAGKILKDALLSGAPEAAAAAAGALRLIEGCQDCGKVLFAQHSKHPDKGIRDLIGVMLELPKAHEH